MRFILVLCLLIVGSTLGQEECISTPEINCSPTLSAPSGNVSSPCFPAKYGGYLRCNTLIITDGSTIVGLEFISFILDVGDFLTIYDGPTTSSPVLFRGTGFTIPDPVVSSGNIMMVTFTSDGEFSSSGFYAEYTSFSSSPPTPAPPTPPPRCGGTLYSNGFVQSPMYPSVYPDGLNCTWFLESSAARSISLSFNSFSTEEKVDFVTVQEGWNAGGIVLFHSSGYIADPFIVKSTFTNQLRVTFLTDGSVGKPGFRAFFN